VSPEHANEQWYKVRFSIEGWDMRVPLVKRESTWVFVTEYAQKIISSPGKRDGLYWDNALGDPKSPLDAKIAEAIEAGYALTGKGKHDIKAI
jgi:hypothetical protein